VVRLLAALTVVALVAGCGASHQPTTTTAPRQLHQFRVVFP
jgi:nitrous oxide reductase accessory protein NosL